jgi:hypothetical protein
MNYASGVLSGLAALFVAELVSVWPFFRESKATGLAVFAVAPFSLRFWIGGVFVFGLFFSASRLRSKVLRVLLLWTPASIISTLGLAIVALAAFVLLFVHKS